MDLSVGMGVTEQVGSDCYAGTITRISKSRKTIWWKRDHRKLAAGSYMSESQEHIHLADSRAEERKAWLAANGKWRTARSGLSGWNHLYVGRRESYRDPSF